MRSQTWSPRVIWQNQPTAVRLRVIRGDTQVERRPSFEKTRNRSGARLPLSNREVEVLLIRLNQAYH